MAFLAASEPILVTAHSSPRAGAFSGRTRETAEARKGNLRSANPETDSGPPQAPAPHLHFLVQTYGSIEAGRARRGLSAKLDVRTPVLDARPIPSSAFVGSTGC